MKGFIRTLEGVIASTLLLTSGLVVAPQLNPEPDIDPVSAVQSELVALEDSGLLPSNVTRSQVRSRISDSVPSSYNYEVVIQRRDTERRSVDFSSSKSLKFERNGTRFGTQLFIRQANDMNVSFNGTKFLTDANSPGYVQQGFETGNASMKFNGSGKVNVYFYNWSTEGSFPTADEVRVVDYPLSTGEEVRVLLWRDRSS